MSGMDLGSMFNHNFVGIVLPDGQAISMVFLDPKETGDNFIVNRRMAKKCPSVSPSDFISDIKPIEISWSCSHCFFLTMAEIKEMLTRQVQCIE